MNNEILTTEQAEAIKKLGLWEKIWSIQKEIKALIKDEKVSFQNYKYFEESQVLGILKPLLEKYRLAMAICDDETQPIHWEKGAGKNKEGKDVIKHYLKYLKVMIITNLDNNKEEKIFKFWACGDNTDLAKAKGSAETYAMKYILSKFFLIRVIDENDPELQEPQGNQQNKEQQDKKTANEFLNKHGWNNNTKTEIK